MKIMNQNINDKIYASINNAITDLHIEYNTKSGDISPIDLFKLDDLINEISIIITNQIKNNL